MLILEIAAGVALAPVLWWGGSWLATGIFMFMVRAGVGGLAGLALVAYLAYTMSTSG